MASHPNQVRGKIASIEASTPDQPRFKTRIRLSGTLWNHWMGNVPWLERGDQEFVSACTPAEWFEKFAVGDCIEATSLSYEIESAKKIEVVNAD